MFREQKVERKTERKIVVQPAENVVVQTWKVDRNCLYQLHHLDMQWRDMHAWTCNASSPIAVLVELTAPLFCCESRALTILVLLNRWSSWRWKAPPTTSIRVDPSLRCRGVSDRRTFSLCQWRWERATFTDDRLHATARSKKGLYIPSIIIVVGSTPYHRYQCILSNVPPTIFHEENLFPSYMCTYAQI